MRYLTIQFDRFDRDPVAFNSALKPRSLQFDLPSRTQRGRPDLNNRGKIKNNVCTGNRGIELEGYLRSVWQIIQIGDRKPVALVPRAICINLEGKPVVAVGYDNTDKIRERSTNGKGTANQFRQIDYISFAGII